MPLHTGLHTEGLEEDDVHLGQEQVRENNSVRRSVKNALASYFFAITMLEGGKVAGDFAFRRRAKPLEWLLIPRRPLDFGVSVTPIAQDALDVFFFTDKPLVLRADDFHQ